MKSPLTLPPLFLFVSLCLTLTSCSSSEYIYVKVKKSELMPDNYEVSYDSLVVGAVKICEMARRYYYKLVNVGGGGLTYTGFTIPDRFAKTNYGEYSAMVGAQEMKLYGKGYLTGADGIKPMSIECLVSPNGITSVIHN